MFSFFYLINILQKLYPSRAPRLLDKNGKEIYEGDIVKSIYDTTRLRGYNPEKREEIMVVEYDNCNPCFVLVSPTNKDRREYDFFVCDLRSNEVIGNIYENGDLLK